MNDITSNISAKSAKQNSDFNISVLIEKFLALFFIEPDGKPLSNLIVKINAGSVNHVLRTDQTGALPTLRFSDETKECSVSVLLPTGIEEIVLKTPLFQDMQCYTFRSPYVFSKAETVVHKAEPGASNSAEKKSEPKTDAKPEPKPVGETKDTRSANEHPVKQVTVPAIDKVHNLMLGENEKYRELILGASQYSGIMPQAIASLINVESAKKYYYKERTVCAPDKKDKKTGKIVKGACVTKISPYKTYTSEWEPTGVNNNSAARGLSQFIKSTWRAEALMPNTHLFEAALNKFGYIEKVTTKKVVHAAVAAKAATKNSPAVPAKAEVSREVVTYKIKDDAKLLALRDIPEYAIYTSVDYGMQNMEYLIKRTPFKVSKMTNDSDKAKLFYLAHHLGVPDVRRFIGNTITDEHAHHIFKYQVDDLKKAVPNPPSKIAADAEKAGGVPEGSCYIFAHRRWALNMIDKGIKPKRYAHDDSKIPEPQTLFNLIFEIGGSHPEGFDPDVIGLVKKK